MNRSNNHLNCNSFIDKIDQYIKMVDWKEDVQTIEHLCSDISKNMNVIQTEVNSQKGREKFAQLAQRIKVEFPEHEKAQEVAGVISCYVNNVFFNVKDVVKLIFSYLTPVNAKQLYKPVSGLRDVGLVSKSFGLNSQEVKKNWVEDNLIQLKIYGHKTADNVVKFIIDNHFKKINLCGFDFNETHLKKIAGSNIQSLDINIKSIKEWPEMDSLTHIIPKNATDKDLVAIAKASPNLTYIDLTTNAKLTEVGVAALVKACSHLTTINLHGGSITDIVVAALVKGGLNLTTIELMGTRVTDIGMVELAKAFPNLTNIDLTRTDVTDIGIAALAKGCLNLTKVNLNSAIITDVGIAKLAKALPNLIEIDLSHTKVTDVGVEALAKACPKLININLYNAKNVADVGVEALAKACPNLIEINLGHAKVTDIGVAALAKGCSNLTKINLAATNVTDICVIELAKGCPKLTMICLAYTKVKDVDVAELIKVYPKLLIRT